MKNQNPFIRSTNHCCNGCQGGCKNDCGKKQNCRDDKDKNPCVFCPPCRLKIYRFFNTPSGL
nr:hypothetical protein [Clostridia bacterium]